MSGVFYLSEIIKFAIEKEEESLDLYLTLADNACDEKMKSLFQRLAKQEVGHEKFYKAMLVQVKNQQSPGVTENEEYKAYMDNLIASKRTTPTIDSLNFSDLESVFDYAIAREHDSISFYTDLKGFVEKKFQDDVDSIIHEEERHAAILEEYKVQL